MHSQVHSESSPVGPTSLPCLLCTCRPLVSSNSARNSATPTPSYNTVSCTATMPSAGSHMRGLWVCMLLPLLARQCLAAPAAEVLPPQVGRTVDRWIWVRGIGRVMLDQPSTEHSGNLAQSDPSNSSSSSRGLLQLGQNVGPGSTLLSAQRRTEWTAEESSSQVAEPRGTPPAPIPPLNLGRLQARLVGGAWEHFPPPAPAIAPSPPPLEPSSPFPPSPLLPSPTSPTPVPSSPSTPPSLPISPATPAVPAAPASSPVQVQSAVYPTKQPPPTLPAVPKSLMPPPPRLPQAPPVAPHSPPSPPSPPAPPSVPGQLNITISLDPSVSSDKLSQEEFLAAGNSSLAQDRVLGAVTTVQLHVSQSPFAVSLVYILESKEAALAAGECCLRPHACTPGLHLFGLTCAKLCLIALHPAACVRHQGEALCMCCM